MIVLLVESVGGVQVGRGHQCAVEVIRPLVVGAYDEAVRSDSSGQRHAERIPLRSGAAEARTAMPADVIERAQSTFAVAHQQDALPSTSNTR